MKYDRIYEKRTLTLSSRAEWRQWLSANHALVSEIWLVYYKQHTNKPTLTKVEANMEALCFGWIDSLIMGIDQDRYMQKFTPRKPGSIWSELNKKRVRELETLGLIEAPGQVLIDHARASGEWEKDRSDPIAVETPSLLAEMLQGNNKAQQAWEKSPPSHQKQFSLWILSAKREETRMKRSQKTIKMLISNLPPNSL